jgi:hypothetical protein
MAVCTALDPWLCVPAFWQICDYRYGFFCFYKVQQNEPSRRQTRREKQRSVIFGSLAILAAICSFRPLTLRPCLSAGSRFVGYFMFRMIAWARTFTLFNFEKSLFIIERRRSCPLRIRLFSPAKGLDSYLVYYQKYLSVRR